MQAFQPGKSLLFMGDELASWHEWSHEKEIEWALLAHPDHAGVARLVADLNGAYRRLAALYKTDFEPGGFDWIVADDTENDVLAWRRQFAGEHLVVVANLTPVVRERYRIGVPAAGHWAELCNTDAEAYGGSGVGNLGGVEADEEPAHGELQSIELRLPPLAVLLFGRES
jgi:1,4-alpha-glucan branching enzyme